MRRLRLGSTSALAELMKLYWPPLVRYATRLVGSIDVAEDLVQEAFVSIWKRRATWSPTGTPRAFLYQVTRNLASKHHRRLFVRRRAVELVRVESLRPATPQEDVEREELRAAFEAALAELPPRRREAFVLARYHQMSLKEIGEVMGTSPQTVANQISAAAADLRRRLDHLRD